MCPATRLRPERRRHCREGDRGTSLANSGNRSSARAQSARRRFAMTARQLRLTVLGWLGALLNLAGMPGFVRDCTYRSASGADVTVRVTRLFTVVTVNEFEIFFYRVSGRIDGVSVTA